MEKLKKITFSKYQLDKIPFQKMYRNTPSGKNRIHRYKKKKFHSTQNLENILNDHTYKYLNKQDNKILHILPMFYNHMFFHCKNCFYKNHQV